LWYKEGRFKKLNDIEEGIQMPTTPRKNVFLLALLTFIFLPVYCIADTTSSSSLAAAVSLSTGSSGASGAPAAAGSAAASGSGTILPDLFTGSMTYSIPIVAPPGRNGMDPGIAFVYRSSRGNGWIGVGWDIEIGAIVRSVKNGVDYAGEDFVLEMSGAGTDLVKKNGTYHAKIEGGFLRIKKIAGTDGDYWEVTDKAGMRYYFGQSYASQQYDTSDSSKVFKWCLDRVEDTNGNFTTFSYTKDQGQIYLKQIDYSDHVNDQVEPLNHIIFHLEPRQDAPAMYTTNFEVRTAFRLKTIEITANGYPIRAYKLEYDTDAIEDGAQYGVSTGRSVLTKIQQYGKDYTIIDGTINGGSALPPVSLEVSQSEKFVTQSWSTIPYYAIEPCNSLSDPCIAHSPYFHVLTGDFNGDGKTDIAYAQTFNWSKWRISLSNRVGNGFTTEEWSTSPYFSIDSSYDGHEKILTGDFNGDGKTDIAHSRSQWGMWRISLSTGTGFVTQDWSTSPYVAIDDNTDDKEQIITGDFNGDGKTDIAHARSGWEGWRVSLSNQDGNGFITQMWSSGSYYAIEPCDSVSCTATPYYYVLTGDFNGDGKTDIAYAHTSNWNKWRISFPNKDGNGFTTEEWSTSPYFAIDNYFDGNEEILTGDFNGDGKTDIAHSRSKWEMWRVSLSKGNGFVTEDWSTSHYWAIDDRVDGNELVLNGDFNGDGKTDIAHARTSWGMWRVSLSNGYEFKTEDWTTSPYLAIENLTDGHERVITGDFSGDGKTDIAHARKEWDGWRVSFDQSAIIPDLLASIKNSLGGTTAIKFKSSTDYDNPRLPFSIQTLNSVSTDDGRGGVSTTTYTYAGGYFHTEEREFRGFEYAKVAGPTGPNGEQSGSETWFLQGNDLGVDFENLGTISTDEIKPLDITNNPDVKVGFMKGRPYFTQITDGQGLVYAKTLTGYYSDTDNLEPYFNPPKEVHSFVCDGNACTVETKVVMGYDDQYGNVNIEYQHGKVGDPADDRTVVRTYGYNSDAWIVSLPISETVYQGIGTTTPVSSAKFYYDDATDCNTPSSNQTPNKGNLTRTVKWLDGGTSPEVLMAYDEYGNLKCTRDANGNPSSTIQYDSTYTFPAIKINAKGHQAVTKYYGVDGELADRGVYGQTKSITDTNGVTLSSEYDAFGRLSRTIDPYTSDSQLGNKSYYYEYAGNVGQQRVTVHSLENNLGVSNSPVSCPAESSYNGITDLCEAGVACSTGSYDSVDNVCVSTAICPAGTTLNTLSDVCETGQKCTPGTLSCLAVQCPSGTTLNRNTGRCEAPPSCSMGTYSGTYDACILSPSCPSGYSIVEGVCSISSICPSGTNLNTATDICEADQNYIWTESYIDGLGRPFMTRSEGTDGKVIATEKEFNSTGTVKRTSLPFFAGIEELRWNNYTYDPMSRVLSVVNPDNTTSSACYNDGTTIMLNADKHRRDEVRDALGRLVTVHEYLGEYDSCDAAATPDATTKYEYDVMGNLLKVIDAENNEIIMQYDTLGRKKYMKDPDMGEWIYAYYPNGDLYTQTDAKGKTITFYYDELNRITKKDYPDGVDVVYTYDLAPDDSAETYPVGRPSTMADESGTTKYFYDKLGRSSKVTRIVDSVNYETFTTYDALGRITSIKYPDPSGVDGEVVQYSYDSGGNLSQVVGYAAFADYNALGQPKTATYGNNVITSYQYDSMNNRLTDILTKNPAQAELLNLTYKYYSAGSVWSITDHKSANRSQTFIYDGLNRLKQAHSITYGPLFYNYDQIGNILLKEGITYKYADDLSITGPAHGVLETTDGKQYTYDANGNMVADTMRSIDYDYDNMPKTVTINNVTTEFKYSGKGSRVKKITPNGTTIYIGKLYECKEGACSKYIFVGGTRLALKTSNDTLYYHQDHLGSSRIMTNQFGEPQEEMYYYPYGAAREDTGAVSVSHKFTSQELDAETELYYYGSRYYDPVLARFISPDTMVPSFSAPQSLNRYSYAYNNPLTYVDPDGHFGILAVMAISATVNATNTYAQGGSFRDIMRSATQGAVNGAIGYTTGGSVSGGMISGGLNAAMNKGNIVQGMVTGGISAGVSGFTGGIQNPALRTFAQIGTSALLGGVTAEMSGGEFRDGFSSGAFTSTMTLALTMACSNNKISKNPDAKAEKSLTVDRKNIFKQKEILVAWDYAREYGTTGDGLTENIRTIENTTDRVFNDVANRDAMVTYTTNGTHGTNIHYEGNAVDLRTRDLTSPQAEHAVEGLRRNLGDDYDVILEGDHIHVEYDPR
jgi:RHS repeat-associated protein